MPKLDGKNIREPLGQEESVHKLSKRDKIRLATGRLPTLDASMYANLPENEGYQLFWEHHMDGAVEKWLYLGAELVRRQSFAVKKFKGFTDVKGSEWECRPVGPDGRGGTLMAYLLKMPADEYYELRIKPNEDRNKEIRDALTRGVAQTDAQVMPNVKGIKTYAPNLPSGGKGFEETHEI